MFDSSKPNESGGLLILAPGGSQETVVEYFPLVSVGIPTFRNAKGLKKTLECIVGQTYPNLEVIISENVDAKGSDQEYASVVGDFLAKYSFVKHYKQKTPLSAGENFEFVFQKSTGAYFMWAADDDYWCRRFVEFLIDKLLREDCVAAFSWCCNEDLLGNRFRLFKFENFSRRGPSRIVKSIMQHEFLGKANLIYSIFKRETVQSVLRVTPIAGGEDFIDAAFVLNICMISRFSIFPGTCFRKVQPIFFPYTAIVNEVSACEQNIFLSKNGKAYLFNILKAARHNKCLIIAFFAIALRLVRESALSSRRFLKKILRKLVQILE